MSRREIKTTRWNSLGEPSFRVMSVVSTKDALQSEATQQTYFKRNYIETLKKIIPQFYFADEEQLSGTAISYSNQLINSHIIANKYQDTILPVSALESDPYLSAINTPQGFARFFYKQNPPATIASDDFERNILYDLSVTYKDYGTSAEFFDYISETLLPSISSVYGEDVDLAATTASAWANDSSGTYKYLVNNLGWLYFLNRKGPVTEAGADSFDPSTGVATLIAQNLWSGRSIVLKDLLNIYQELLWKNEPYWDLDKRIIPEDFVSGAKLPPSARINKGKYASGTQQLDRLKTLNDIVYSPHFLDSPDVFVEEAFTNYLTTSTVKIEGTLLSDVQGAGPFTRFLEGMSYSFADRLTEGNELAILYDIGKCPDEFLDLLADLIGWRFLGADVDKWRVQLRNAVEVYKKKGTKASIQLLLDILFGVGVFYIEPDIDELWESYVPDMIYYALATSSAAFKDFRTYTPEVALQLGMATYSPTNMDMNIKYGVDEILFNLVREFPGSFFLGGKPFPQLAFVKEGTDIIYSGAYHTMSDGGYITYMTGGTHTQASKNLELVYDPDFTFKYRNRVAFIPPYEKRQYYTQTFISRNMLDRIEFWLRCFGVDKNFAEKIKEHIRDYTTNTLDTARITNNFLMFDTEPS